jgi:nucleoside-diphosphate-sugar epimerase
MKILIIGGTRFLGYHIAKRLLQDGHNVTLFNRGQAPYDFGSQVRRITGDRYDKTSFYEKLSHQTFDVVVDMISYNAEDSQSAVRTFQGKVGHFIHISTAAVYIVTRDYPCPLKEEDFRGELSPEPKTTEHGMWTYGYNKRKCELVLSEAFKKNAFPVTIFRPSVVMGEKDYTLRPYSYFVRILDDGPLIVPDGGLNVFTHVYQDDIVRTLASNLMNSSSFGQAYNLAQEEIMSLRRFLLKSCDFLKKETELVDIPSRILKKTPMGLSFSPFSSRRPLVLDANKARKELQFSSTPFNLWIEKTIRWFVEIYEGDPPENYKFREKEIEFIQKYKNMLQTLVQKFK